MRDWKYEDLSTLPDDATPGTGGWGYGSDVFGHSGCLIIADSSTPVRVWKLPPAVCRFIDQSMKEEYERGKIHVQQAVRDALGLEA